MDLALPERQRNSSRVGRARLVSLVVAASALGPAAPVRADGAFPDSQSILLPRDRPNEIIVGTTFGLVFSEDNGATWRYSCENDATRNGRRYALGAPPNDRIYALSDVGVPATSDGACTWAVGGGDIVALMPFDVFPDPSDPVRVFVLADNPDDGLASAYRSLDAGATYVGPIFKSPSGAVITGIESARSAPQTVYLTLYQGPGTHPVLAESADGGDTWTMTDIEAGVGAVVPYLAAVDPVDPRRIYMRITSGPGDPQIFQGLAITPDGGKTWSIPLKAMNGSLVGFARLPDGNLFLVGTTAPAVSGESPVPAAFRSNDLGQTFTTMALPFHPAGLAERSGALFVATNFLDGFAAVSSEDDGRTWRTRLRFLDIAGMKDCVRATCQADCDTNLASRGLFPPEVCNPSKPPRPPGGCGCHLAAGQAAGRTVDFCAPLLLFVWAQGRHRGRRVPR